MRLKAALEGDLKKHMKEEYRTAERARYTRHSRSHKRFENVHASPGTFVRFGAAHGQYMAR